MIVIDASALLEILKQTGTGHDLAESLAGQDLHAPHLIDLEVANTLRRWVMRGEMPVAEARLALDDLTEMPITRHAHAPMLHAVWNLRNNLTAYDAAYLALARALKARLVTQDEGLRKAAARGPAN